MKNNLKVETDLLRSFSNGHINTELCGGHFNWYGCCRCLDSFNDSVSEYKMRKVCKGLKGKRVKDLYNVWCRRCWRLLMGKREDQGLRPIEIEDENS